ncbi:MAG: ribonuclease P protein component [Prevotellaceae bacterium]|jgi:ribonuclease P protein component|nr:ribonuclease P protein component [Prevotellaceae bacterium]
MNGFRKKERLCSKKQIEMLFMQGNAVFVFPFKIYYRLSDATAASQAAPCRVMITVPKRHFKKAVHRNVLKRRTREAFRLHKQELTAALTAQGKSLQLILHYVSETILPYKSVAEAIKNTNSALIQQAEL